ncbi:hypothetical protein P7C73_g6230, partial [Tremellales sp. Uapishka_1]
MRPPTKRTRTPTEQDPSDDPSQPTPSSPPPAAPTTRRTTSTTHVPAPARPIPTRSTTTITRSTRGSFGLSHGSMPNVLGGPRASGSGGGGGMLLRTQSTPAIVSPTQVKAWASAAAGGSGGRAGKGDDGPEEMAGPSGRRFGKGKENIPPKREEEENEEGSRKRIRVARTSTGGRGRSGSVMSVRSESSGRHASLAPSTSFTDFSRPSGLPSPSPSPSSATTASFGSSSSDDVEKTPTKARATPRRKPPTTAGTGLPTPPPSSPSSSQETAVEQATDGIEHVHIEEERKTNPYKILKSYLRLSSVSTGTEQVIVGRAEEKEILHAYLGTEVVPVPGMYVSGPPGTGKTALVTALGREMACRGWQVVELGCMGLKVADMWKSLGAELGCGKDEKQVREWIEREGAQTFIILDEIDSLLPPSPALPPPATSHLLSKLFSLPLASPTIKLVAISNTLDLTLRARLVLPDGIQPQILPFKAYGSTEMTSIVAVRTQDYQVKVDTKAVELLARKVEAQNGDLRMCLGVLSSAVTLAENEYLKRLLTHPDLPLVKVSLPHILKAFTSHTQQLKAAAGSTTTSTSTTGKKIRSVPLQGKLVLVAMLVAKAKLTSTVAFTTTTLYNVYAEILSHKTSPIRPASESDYRDLLSNLEVLGLIACLKGKAGQASKIEWCVREDEIKDGLGLGMELGSGGLAEEEVGKIWEREWAKLERAARTAEAAPINVEL